MIYKCRCGHSSYHQGEVSNPYCPECHYNKSEIAPMPGEFKARIRSDIDPERLNAEHLNAARLKVGNDVLATVSIFVRVPGLNAHSYAILSLDAAQELLEVPSEYGPSIFAQARLMFMKMKKVAEASGHIIVSEERLKTMPFDAVRIKQEGAVDRMSDGTEIVCKDPFVKSRLGRKGTKPENFKHVLIDLIEKLKRCAKDYTDWSSGGKMNQMAKWAEDEITRLKDEA